MRSGRLYYAFFLFAIVSMNSKVDAQLSPGDLSSQHAHLEGISNCTQCHVLGNKVAGEKCLACHTELGKRIGENKGYHSSAEVKGKDCSVCHSEHNGKDFQLVRLETSKFDHNLTGYTLSQPHAKKNCVDCHNSKNITDPKIKTKKFTYLGLQEACLTCHSDYHQQTLSASCLNCHTDVTFKPASKFNHSSARFQLNGKHKSVECQKCHRIETVNGKKFQEFRGVQFSNCTSCHKDPHQNKFGQNCRQCHTEDSFLKVKSTGTFDHSKTSYPLQDKHLSVDCKACHKTKYTDPLKHDRCTDCHTDYHRGQFTRNGIVQDCSQCHSIKGFTSFSFTIEQHNKAVFPLQGSHAAVPCIDCHRKQEKWNFREIGINCMDCHQDIHKSYIQEKYYPGFNCKVCHKEQRWSDIAFDHSKTGFLLTGAHAAQNCRACHFPKGQNGVVVQKFNGLSESCTSCHTDNHYKQFDINGTTDCNRCHGTENWKASKFDHDKTTFRLDGKHITVACAKCHKPQQEGSITYIRYKLKEYRCESCHF